MRGLSNSSCLLFERKTNHVSTSIQITGGSKGPNQPLVTSQSAKSRSDLRRFGGRLQREMSQAFKQQKRTYDIWVVVSMIFYFHPYILGERIQFDYIIFSGGVGWNHQPDMDCEKLPVPPGWQLCTSFSPPKHTGIQTPFTSGTVWPVRFHPRVAFVKTPVDWLGFYQKGWTITQLY